VPLSFVIYRSLGPRSGGYGPVAQTMPGELVNIGDHRLHLQ
jgi:hypothetical protein